MDDDLGTPAPLAEIFDLARRANPAADAGDQDEGRAPGSHRRASCAAPSGSPSEGREERRRGHRRPGRRPRRARAARDYARADAIRAELEAEGWLVEDGPAGGELHR